jgi:16S rRNA (guanine966-N2)-methyltransferase
MSLKILGGLAKGLPLKMPKEQLIRPTSMLLTRKLFDARQDLSNSYFLDLCAGTGHVGLEAWSHGASRVDFVEGDKRVFSFLEENLSKVRALHPDETKARPIFSFHSTVEKWLDFFLRKSSTDFPLIIFLDPPYEKKQIYRSFFLLLAKYGFRGEVWVESDRLKGIPCEEMTTLAGEYASPGSVKTYSQGDSYVSCFKLFKSLEESRF